jgi:polysaccharide export outer membrane protein
MQNRFQIVQKIASALLMAVFLAATVSCQSADVRGTSQQASNSEQGYQLGPEDILLISVWKDEHLTREVVVRPDGLISFPLVGDVPAEGRTVEELRLDLAKRLIKYIPAVNITVAVVKPLSYKVYVVGRVAKPGEFLVGHYTDVLQALSLAGGLTPFAAENDIKIVRRVMGQQQTFPFRYSDVRKGTDLDQNIILQRGDVVMVP